MALVAQPQSHAAEGGKDFAASLDIQVEEVGFAVSGAEPQARMPPVEVPATRSKKDTIERPPVYRPLKSCQDAAGKIRDAPPSIDKMRKRRSFASLVELGVAELLPPSAAPGSSRPASGMFRYSGDGRRFPFAARDPFLMKKAT